MLQAFPHQQHRVVARNHCRAQQSRGLVWFGKSSQPLYALVKLGQGEKPISVEGHDLILHEGEFAAYGNKKLLRHRIDCQIDRQNRLFFPSLAPGNGLGQLIKWLIRKNGLRLSPEEELEAQSGFDLRNLSGWAQEQPDLFNPKNRGFLVYGEPAPAQIRAILRVRN